MDLWLILLLCTVVVVGTHLGLFLWFARMIKRSSNHPPPKT